MFYSLVGSTIEITVPDCWPPEIDGRPSLVDQQKLIPFIYLTIPLGIRFLVKVLEILLNIYICIICVSCSFNRLRSGQNLVLARENPEL